MSRADQLRSALDRASARERQAYTKFTCFASDCDMADRQQLTRRHDLQHELEQAQRDVAWMQRQLEAALLASKG